MRTISTLVFTLLFAVTVLSAKVIKVPQDYAKIQLAIEAAVNGDTVLVSEGTYFENLLLKKKIVLGSLYIIDGDISHISKTILDGSNPRHADSASVILITTGADGTTVVSGFTIQGRHGTKYNDVPSGLSWRAGGGINILAGGATIAHNVIRGNTITSSTADGAFSGGINIYPWNGPITSWIFEQNQILNNTVSMTATISAMFPEGGGVGIGGGPGIFRYNTVANNVAVATSLESAAGGISISGAVGYGVANIECSNNLFMNNSARLGGAIVSYADATDSAATPHVTFANNVIAYNTGLNGSAIVINSGDFNLINNTIAYNSAGSEAIRLFALRGTLGFRLLNNIVWNPTSTSEFYNGGLALGNNNIVRGGFAGTGNINSDPLFVANDSLFHLSNSSPCIGAGISSASVGGVTLNAPLFDYFNTTRPRPTGSNPDIGAVENDLSLDEKTGLAVFGLGRGRSMSFREITLSEAGTQLRARYYGPYVIKKDSMVGSQHWFFDPAFNAWLWYGSGGLWLKFLPFTPTFDSSRNLLLKWPCKKGDTYNTRFLGLVVAATVDAVDSIITVPASTDTCVVVTFRTSGQVMTRMCFAPGIGWIKEDDYYTYSTMDVINFLPLVSYPHFRYEVTAFSLPTGVQELHSETPVNWKLMQNYPNPFNPTTVISYQLPVISKVTLKIYDVLGREVATLVDEVQPAGWKEVRWDAKDVSSGIYFYKLTAGSLVDLKKMVLIK